ncbi:MAG: hypothetical protein ACK54C_13465 [Betaproteobacteria bacterium]|jgi:hypothetical protein
MNLYAGQRAGADPAAVIRGERKAQQLITVIRASLTAGDELERALRRLPADELPGFARALQKDVEARR